MMSSLYLLIVVHCNFTSLYRLLNSFNFFIVVASNKWKMAHRFQLRLFIICIDSLSVMISDILIGRIHQSSILTFTINILAAASTQSILCAIAMG